MASKFTFNHATPIAAALALALVQPLAWSQTPAQPASGAGMGNKSMDMKGMDSKGMDSKGMDMRTMMKNNDDKMASMKMTGNADVDFAMMMRVHHQGAIEMAEAELRDGKDAQMRKLAKNIIAAQKKEIAQLDKFLTKNGQPAGPMNK